MEPFPQCPGAAPRLGGRPTQSRRERGGFKGGDEVVGDLRHAVRERSGVGWGEKALLEGGDGRREPHEARCLVELGTNGGLTQSTGDG
jgi:hypothetical protein